MSREFPLALLWFPLLDCGVAGIPHAGPALPLPWPVTSAVRRALPAAIPQEPSRGPLWSSHCAGGKWASTMRM